MCRRELAIESGSVGHELAVELGCVGRELAVVCEGEAADFVGDNGGVV